MRAWIFEERPDLYPGAAAVVSPRGLFVSCILLYCIYMLLMQPDWVLGGDMWAEMATNYYSSSVSPQWFDVLFSTDAGYVPLPQRILAAIGRVLNVPAASIPYLYTWAAIIFTAGMVGVFCLERFRSLVRSDGLRFFAVIAILLVADFETRTFINFTYFAAFFVAAVTALAFVDGRKDVPWWAYFIPVISISKPAVLSVLPAMIMVAVFSGNRFRVIAAFTLLLCVAQVARMAFSHSTGVFSIESQYGFYEKIVASCGYFLGFLGAFFVGKAHFISAQHSIWLGGGVFLGCAFLALRLRNGASVLMLVGLSILFFNVFMNCFALSDTWNVGMDRLSGVPLYRHIIVGYFGEIFVIVGLVSAFSDFFTVRLGLLRSVASVFLFLLWFYASGWLAFAGEANRAPRSPVINNSQWQELAKEIDSGADVCVPIDPLGWFFQRGCAQLGPDFGGGLWGREIRFGLLGKQGRHIDLVIPSSARGRGVSSLAILVRPEARQSIYVDAVVTFKGVNGGGALSGGRWLDASGGLLMLTARDVMPHDGDGMVRVDFSTPVSVGGAVQEDAVVPIIFWMGK